MKEMEKSTGEEDEGELKLTLSEDTELLERDLQQEACRGICQDIIIGQLACDDSHNVVTLSPDPPKRWPLVVVDRRGPGKPFVQGRSRYQRKNQATPSPTHVENVDLVFIDEDKESCVLAIEVCSSSSDKIADLHELQRTRPS